MRRLGNGPPLLFNAPSVFSLPRVRLALNGFDTTPLVERCAYLRWIKKGQPPDLMKRNQAESLPFTERPHRRFPFACEDFVNACLSVY
jgi:hypothetical protein